MRIIAHLDMDAFFAAVEERDNPRLKGQPVVVGSDPKDGAGRGVVATANYKARVYGIRSAMPISKAWRLAEEGARKGGLPVRWVYPNGRKYGEASGKIFEIVRSHISEVEEASVDEAYLDLSFAGSYEEAKRIAEELKKEIKEKERLTASIGIGPNKLIAKIASDREKPDGLTVVKEEEAEAFLEPLPVRTIPGIGPKAEEMLKARGIAKVGEIRRYAAEELAAMFGKWGKELYFLARGQDDRPIVLEYEAKSIGAEETFDKDERDPKELNGLLSALSQRVFQDFRGSGFGSFGRVAIKVRFSDFTTKTRSRALGRDARSGEEIAFEAMRLFMPFMDARENPGKKAVRLLGVRIEKLKL